MTAQIGHTALLVGMLASAAGCYWWLVAARAQTQPAGRDQRLANRWGAGMTLLAVLAALVTVAALEWALLSHDFSIRYVAENGSRAVPTYYTVISLWAALEGSLLLWVLVLTGYTAAVLVFASRRGEQFHRWALAVLSALSTFFFGLALFAGNAFHRVAIVPADGPGPNPLLQDHPLMGVHPPLLYLGYVGMAVPFAYAVAALITGHTGGGWVALIRRWTLFAWTCLTIAIFLGAWWAYEVLGWGGYWSWDPVENVSIIPWFVATALVHSVMTQRRRVALRVWNLTLAMAVFLLVLVGTFITRSGVIESVHSFTQSAIGPALLAGIVVVFVGCGVLLLWRADRLGPDDGLGGGLSREAMFLGNNLLLVALALTVLLGTVFPLVAEAVDGTRISVGEPYFNQVAIPLALAVILLMGVGPLVPWGKAAPRALGRRLIGPALVGLTVIGALGLAGLSGITPLITFGLAAFVLSAIGVTVIEGVATVRRGRDVGWWVAARRFAVARRRFLGGMVVHSGVVLAAVAIAASSTYTEQQQRKLEVGETISVGTYGARLVSVDRHRDDRRMWVSARLDMSSDGRALGTEEPELSFYPGRNNRAIGTPSVRTGSTADAYVVVSEADPAGRWAVVSLSVRPLMVWLWVASGVMAVGAVLAGWPTRRRRTRPLIWTRARHGEPAGTPS
ncbi:MAG: heme lyase CcmF/NrfE family subunit [Actinophytocola sp.]|nr:heme lyase CcmF/NrfE family subunit [Actinophytocola sp.]